MEGNSKSRASKRLATIMAVLIVCSGLAHGSQSLAAGAWVNEPPGFSRVVDCSFSGSTCPPMWNAYNTEAYATDSTAPQSPDSVFDTYMAVGSNVGSGQWGVNFPNVREVFAGFWWRTNSAFQGVFHGNNKLFFIRGNVDNNFMNWQGGPDAPKTLQWYTQQTTTNNCHIPSYYSPGCASGPDYAPGSGWFNPNVNGAAATVSAGSGWHKVEIYQKASTTASSRDGIIRIWVDGVLSSSFTNVNLAPSGFSDAQINYAWDGSIACGAPNSRDCSREWHHYWDHLYISIGQGGSTTDQPPGPPASPRIVGVTIP